MELQSEWEELFASLSKDSAGFSAEFLLRQEKTFLHCVGNAAFSLNISLYEDDTKHVVLLL